MKFFRLFKKVKEPSIHHSVEVEEIMGRIPSRIARTGIFVLLGLGGFILIGSYLIKYPKKVTVPVTLTTKNPPAPLIAKTSGRIERLFLTDREHVSQNSEVALIKNSTSYEDLKVISSFLEQLSGDWQKDLNYISLPSKVKLGTIQNAYVNFYKSFEQFKIFNKHNDLESSLRIQEHLIQLQEEYISKVKIQLEVKREKYRVVQSTFQIDSIYYSDSGYGISKKEYEQSLQLYLLEKESLVAIEASLSIMNSELVRLHQGLVNLKKDYFEKLDSYIITLNESVQLLETEIEQWKLNYLLSSPIAGTVVFTTYWSSNQSVEVGKRIATIIPDKPLDIIARAYIKSENVALLESGQIVHIRLSGFPYFRYGTLNGIVINSSLVPDDEGYVVEIKLTHGMISSYEERMKFVQEMEGIADIITEDSRLIDRILDPIKSIL